MMIDNVVVEVGPAAEIPIVEAVNTLGFCDAILSAGIEVQNEIQPCIVVDSEMEFKIEGSTARIAPSGSNQLCVSAEIDFPKPINKQSLVFSHVDAGEYYSSIAAARSFIRSDLSHRWENGTTTSENISKHLLLLNSESYADCLLMFDNGEWIKQGGDPEEPIKHKIQDVLGDFALLGRPVIGQITIYKPGHVVNLEIAIGLAMRYIK